MIYAWFRSLIRWAFVEPSPLWFGILGTFGVSGLSWLLPGSAEFRMRFAGYAVTLVGVGLVAKSIYETHQLFGKPALTFRVSQWLQRIPRLPRATIIGASASGSVSFGGAANATLRYNAPEGASLEDRIAAMERNVASIDKETSDTRVRLDRELGELREQHREATSLQRRNHSDLASRLEKYSAEGLDYEIVGAVCVVFGQALSSFPSEFATQVSGLLARAG